MKLKILHKSFYERDTKIVAVNLLGKILVRKINSKKILCKIVETEAYYGKEDPASRVSLGRPRYCVELMYGDVGKCLIYMVHSNWLFNIVAHSKNGVGAILIRAVEPLDEKLKEKINLFNGPGKLTKTLKITKSDLGKRVYDKSSDIIICKTNKGEKIEFENSHRIGVKKDLDLKLRFFIKNNPFVSTKAGNR